MMYEMGRLFFLTLLCINCALYSAEQMHLISKQEYIEHLQKNSTMIILSGAKKKLAFIAPRTIEITNDRIVQAKGKWLGSTGLQTSGFLNIRFDLNKIKWASQSPYNKNLYVIRCDKIDISA